MYYIDTNKLFYMNIKKETKIDKKKIMRYNKLIV